MLEALKTGRDQKKASLQKVAASRTSRRIGLGIILVGLLTMLFPSEKEYEMSEPKVGDISKKEIIAPFTFAVEKSETDLKREKEAAGEKVPPVIVRNEELGNLKMAHLDSFFTMIQELLISELPDSAKLHNILLRNPRFTEESLHLLVSPDRTNGARKPGARPVKGKLSVAERLWALHPPCRKVLWSAYRKGIIQSAKDIRPKSQGMVTVARDGMETAMPLEDLIDLEMVKAEVIQVLSGAFPEDNQTVRLGYEICIAFLTPNIFYDEVETEMRRHDAEAAVQTSKAFILEGQRIIDSHVMVTQDHVDAINSFIGEREARNPQKGLWRMLAPLAGRIALICLLLCILGLYLRICRPKIFANTRLLAAIGLVCLLTVASGSFIFRTATFSQYLVPVTVASMLLTILFDAELAIVGTVTIAFTLASLWGYDFPLGLLSLFTGTTAVFCMAHVRHRHDFYRAMLYIPLMYVVSITVFNIIRLAPSARILTDYGYGIANGILSPLLTIALLPLFEILFHLTTDVTLFEISDLNRPLLKRLSLEAPGTYTHSIWVGDLAEAACDAIGANALLARTGAYYHDIGKLTKPKYFRENLEFHERNPHDRLSPSMSSLILASHVKEGCDLSRKHKLPHVIHDFIRQHHGTSLMVLFYQKALALGGDDAPDEAKYRYSGPKPQTKEAGILMLADAVHAAVISLKEKDRTPGRIKGLVNTIFENKFSDGQLNESDLTLKDLAIVEKTFLLKLKGILHEREEYPDPSPGAPKTTIEPRRLAPAFVQD